MICIGNNQESYKGQNDVDREYSNEQSLASTLALRAQLQTEESIELYRTSALKPSSPSSAPIHATLLPRTGAG
jgi:hypothetical protein